MIWFRCQQLETWQHVILRPLHATDESSQAVTAAPSKLCLNSSWCRTLSQRFFQHWNFQLRSSRGLMSAEARSVGCCSMQPRCYGGVSRCWMLVRCAFDIGGAGPKGNPNANWYFLKCIFKKDPKKASRPIGRRFFLSIVFRWFKCVRHTVTTALTSCCACTIA